MSTCGGAAWRERSGGGLHECSWVPVHRVMLPAASLGLMTNHGRQLLLKDAL